MYQTYYNLGIAATNAKKYDIAIDAFEDGMKLKTEYPNFYYSLAIAQSAYADSLIEGEEVSTDEDEKDEKKEISDEDKTKAAELKVKAVINLKKYLELSPNAEDKEIVEELIKDCEAFGKEPEVQETKVLEG